MTACALPPADSAFWDLPDHLIFVLSNLQMSEDQALRKTFSGGAELENAGNSGRRCTRHGGRNADRLKKDSFHMSLRLTEVCRQMHPATSNTQQCQGQLCVDRACSVKQMDEWQVYGDCTEWLALSLIVYS